MRGVGYFLGLTIGALIVFAIISFIFLRPKKVEKIEVVNFIKSSVKIRVQKVKWAGGILANDDERLGIKTMSKITYFSNRNMTYIRANTYTYFSEELNKYIRTYSISESGNMSSVVLDFGGIEKDRNKYPDMFFYYNKTQNADPTFGTIDKPLPILHFRSADPGLRSMRQNNKDADSAYLKMIYEENVKLYLEYFIDKEDFKKLFPDS